MKQEMQSPGERLAAIAARNLRLERLRPTMDDGDFLRFQSLIERETGIFISEAKREMLVGRLQRRLRKISVETFFDYYRLVTHAGSDEKIQMIDAVCTNETSFFRESPQFDFLRQELIPRWTQEALEGSRPRSIRVWSAGCSTGEEPYSLSMLFSEHFPVSQGWDVQIIATDISTRALETASTGIWPHRKQADIPREYLQRYMLRSNDDSWIQAGTEIRSLIRFARLNLAEEEYPLDGPFDMIFCRNVLIYFQPQLRLRVKRNICERLGTGGLLFLGHAETLTEGLPGVRSVIPNVYQYNLVPSTAEVPG